MSDQNNDLMASLSTLLFSLGSNAEISLGLSPHPETGKVEKDLQIAKFNIDLLKVIKNKTSNNLTDDENKLMTHLLSDLQLKFVDASSAKN